MKDWAVTGPGGGHFTYEAGKWTADPDTARYVRELAGLPVLMTPTGPAYTPAGPDDPTGLYLLALAIVPGPLTITGTPPPTPDGPTVSPGVAY